MANKLTGPQIHLIGTLEAQAKAAAENPGTYSRGMTPGSVGCHKTVAASLVKVGLLVAKADPCFVDRQIVDLPS